LEAEKLMFLKEEDFGFVLKNPEVYNNLFNSFRESDSFYNALWDLDERLFYQKFRLWLTQEFNCYNDGTCFLYFNTEKDYVWFRLKYG
jgi:hypothetical protein